MKRYYVWQTVQKGGYEFNGILYNGRFYPKTPMGLHSGFGSTNSEIVNIVSHNKGEHFINLGITLFSKATTGSVQSFLDCPLVYFNNFINSSFSLLELFPNYVWEHLDVNLFRLTGYGRTKNSGVLRVNKDYTFTLLGDIV